VEEKGESASRANRRRTAIEGCRGCVGEQM